MAAIDESSRVKRHREGDVADLLEVRSGLGGLE